MHITKTDYLEYTYCKKNLWLKKHKRELFEGVELSEFEKKIIEEGNHLELLKKDGEYGKLWRLQKGGYIK